MAINKTVNKSTKTHGAMRNCMEYVLRDSKINSSLVMERVLAGRIFEMDLWIC